jgi:hypothetical protein
MSKLYTAASCEKLLMQHNGLESLAMLLLKLGRFFSVCPKQPVKTPARGMQGF